MRLRIAMLLGVVFTLAVIVTATSTPASAAQQQYGPCVITTLHPQITDSSQAVMGAVKISCGPGGSVAYRVYTCTGTLNYCDLGNSGTIVGPSTQTFYGRHDYANPGAAYGSRAIFQGYDLYDPVVSWPVLHGAIPYLYW